MRSKLKQLANAMNRCAYLDTHTGPAELIAGTGRGGTTWLAQLINHDNAGRLMFEPVMPDRVALFASLSRRPYLTRGADEPQWAHAMDRVFTGRLRNAWVDAHNTKRLASRRLVKDIRLNLALPWVAQHYPEVPIVWLLRHPCAVAYSKLRLGWETHLDLFLGDGRLMADRLSPYRALLTSATAAWDRHLLMWCVETLVPLGSLRTGDALAVCYEDLCDTPWPELDRVFDYLGRPYRKAAMQRAIDTRSATHRRGSAVVTGADPVAGWMQHVTPAQRRRADELLQAFGLDSIYCAHNPRPNSRPGDLIGAQRDAG